MHPMITLYLISFNFLAFSSAGSKSEINFEKYGKNRWALSELFASEDRQMGTK